MKKKIVVAALVVTVAVGAAWNINQVSNESGISDLMLGNIEALAEENDGGNTYACWSTVSTSSGSSVFHDKTYCSTCQPVPATWWDNQGLCRR